MVSVERCCVAGVAAAEENMGKGSKAAATAIRKLRPERERVQVLVENHRAKGPWWRAGRGISWTYEDHHFRTQLPSSIGSVPIHNNSHPCVQVIGQGRVPPIQICVPAQIASDIDMRKRIASKEFELWSFL